MCVVEMGLTKGGRGKHGGQAERQQESIQHAMGLKRCKVRRAKPATCWAGRSLQAATPSKYVHGVRERPHRECASTEALWYRGHESTLFRDHVSTLETVSAR